MAVKCTLKEGRRDLFTLHVDGEPWRDIHRNIFGPKPKLKLDPTSSESLDEQFLDQEYIQVKRFVIKRLGIKNYPSFELRKCLLDSLVSEKNAERIIEECRSHGYINDKDWVDAFVRYKQAQNMGPQAIAMKLRAKGTPQQMIAEVLAKIEEPSSQQQQILHLLRTRYSSRDLSQYKEKQKVIAALARKGYNFDHILQTIEQINADRLS